jgi:hypothetical protein
MKGRSNEMRAEREGTKSIGYDGLGGLTDSESSTRKAESDGVGDEDDGSSLEERTLEAVGVEEPSGMGVD